MEKPIKNELLEQLLNSKIEENLEFGSLLLSSQNIPQEEREVYINQILTKFLGSNGTNISKEVLENVINARNNLSAWMTSQGSSWRGFNTVPTSPSTSQATFDAQMNAYLSYPGWGIYEPAIIEAPISTTSGGNDAYGNPIEAYKFQTTQIPVGAFSATSWVMVFVATGSTNGQKYSTVKNGTSAGSMTSRVMNTNYNSLVINYSGTTNIPTGTYKLYSTFAGTSFQLSTGFLPNYIQGGTLV